MHFEFDLMDLQLLHKLLHVLPLQSRDITLALQEQFFRLPSLATTLYELIALWVRVTILGRKTY